MCTPSKYHYPSFAGWHDHWQLPLRWGGCQDRPRHSEEGALFAIPTKMYENTQRTWRVWMLQDDIWRLHTFMSTVDSLHHCTRVMGWCVMALLRTQHTRLSPLAWRSSCLWTSLAPPSSARMARSRKVQRHDMNLQILFLKRFWFYYFLLIFYSFPCFLQVSARRPASQMASWAWIAAPSPLRRTLRQCGDVHAVSPLEVFF